MRLKKCFLFLDHSCHLLESHRFQVVCGCNTRSRDLKTVLILDLPLTRSKANENLFEGLFLSWALLPHPCDPRHPVLVNIYVYMYLYKWMYEYVYAYMYVYTCVYIYTRVYVCVCIYIHTHIYMVLKYFSHASI